MARAHTASRGRSDTVYYHRLASELCLQVLALPHFTLQLTIGKSTVHHVDPGHMAATAVSTRIHALLERPDQKKSEESALTYLNSQFPSLENLRSDDDFLAVVEQAEQQDQGLTDRVRTNDDALRTIIKTDRRSVARAVSGGT